jgi:hypothetical protein
MNDSVMMSSEKKSAGPTSAAESAITRQWFSPLSSSLRMRVFPMLEVFVRVLDHHDRRVDHRADRDRDAAQRHDVGVDTLVAHDDEGREDAERQRHDGDEGRAQVEQEDETHDATTTNSSASLCDRFSTERSIRPERS